MRRPLLLVALAAAASTAVDAAPAPGRYDGQLCVATVAGAPPSCGAAMVELLGGGRVEVRVADIAWRLALRSSQLDALTMHGNTQIAEFSADYEWIGDVLRFTDAARGAAYEVRIQASRPAR